MSQYCSRLIQIKAVGGVQICRSSGREEIDRFLEIPDVIWRMGQSWEMSQNEIDRVCHRIEDITEGLQDRGMVFGQ